ncbi:Heavy metal binding domain-containing protein [Flavobacterium longum]|uniref:heavy metal-binding domain-containing protein n=1 Tax=Flavobacterium longum TaxID=1299340 RepID=UPI0039E915FF
MKNFIFLMLTVLSLTACNSKGSKTESTDQTETTTETSTNAVDTTAVKEPVAELYSCPMHPEVKGEKDSECPKCGMKLTEPVK